MGLFRKKQQPQQPTVKEMKKADVEAKMAYTEANAPPQVDAIAFDFQVLDDEKMLTLFDPESELFQEWLVPYLPLISRVMFLTNISQREADMFMDEIDFELTRLKYRRRDQDEKALVRSLKIWLKMRIHDSVNGWKLGTLTERRRRVLLESLERKERGGLIRR